MRRLLILNSSAGRAAAAAERLQAELGDHRVLELGPGQALAEAYRACPTTTDAVVVVSGGDGTVGAAVRCLAGSGRTLGIVPTGTYNNFARGLGLPLEPGAAIEVIKTGRPRWVGLGRAGGQPFVEAAGIGFFGEAILAGEAAKELRAGELLGHLRGLAGQAPFRYRLSGDARGSGTATSIIVANTATVGAGIVVGDASPNDPRLEVIVEGAENRLGALWGLLMNVLRRRTAAPQRSHRVSRVRIETGPAAPVFADVFEVGTTPVEFEARPRDLKVMLPR